MLKGSRSCRFSEKIDGVHGLQCVGGHGLDDAAHQTLRCGGDIVEGVEVLLHVENVVTTDGKNGVDVGANHLLAINLGLADPACTTCDVGGSDQVCIRLEAARDPVHEVGLIEFGEHGGIVIRLQCMVSYLAGVGTGQQVALVSRIHDETTTLCSATERSDVRVGEDVPKRCTNFEQSAVLVFVARISDPLIQAGLNAVEFQGDHL